MDEKNIWELRENLSGLGEKVKQTAQLIHEKSMSTDISEENIAEIKELKEKEKNLKYKYDILREEYEQVKKRNNLRSQKVAEQKNPKNIREEAFAKLIRQTMNNTAVTSDVYEALGDNGLGDDATTNGSKFLPKTVSSDIITAPAEKNPLRQLSTITAISNLELPRLAFSLDDDGFIADKETAKEMQAKGDVVTFTRNKLKVEVGVSETVLLGSAANLTNYVEQALRDGITRKERNVAFAESPSVQAEKHMSFYEPTNNVKKVQGADLYEAIMNALADLNEDYRANATIVMNYADYLKILKTLANGSTTLYGAQPEQVLGKPVVFCDSATKPIVGDFSYSHYNYSPQVQYDTQKDIHRGINYFVVTTWFDHQIKLTSAFRIADVQAGKA